MSKSFQTELIPFILENHMFRPISSDPHVRNLCFKIYFLPQYALKHKFEPVDDSKSVETCISM
jgi:hypothetical protein